MQNSPLAILGKCFHFEWRLLQNLMKEHEYDNTVHFEGVRLICGPHLVIIGLSEARADLLVRQDLQVNLAPEK